MMEKSAIFYGSNGGATETVAKKIAKRITNGIEVLDVADVAAVDVTKYTNIIFGTSTWGVGDLQDDWEGFLPDLAKIDLSDKTIAIFGLGDSDSYPDSFVDGMGTIYEGIKDRGGRIVGQVEPDGYKFDDSKAVYNGKFVGLPLDEDNESDQTDKRIEAWLQLILPEFK